MGLYHVILISLSYNSVLSLMRNFGCLNSSVYLCISCHSLYLCFSQITHRRQYFISYNTWWIHFKTVGNLERGSKGKLELPKNKNFVSRRKFKIIMCQGLIELMPKQCEETTNTKNYIKNIFLIFTISKLFQ